MADVALIPRLLDGDPEVVAKVRVWIRAAFRPYQSRLGPDLEDLEQDILLELTRALRAGKFEGQSKLRTYVRAYAHHKCIDRIRAQGRRQWVDVDDLELPSPSPSPLDALSRSEAAEQALRVLEEMPESCRELWRMLQEGMRYREMSRRLGIGEGALRARVLRCRRRALKARVQIYSESVRNKTRGPSTR